MSNVKSKFKQTIKEDLLQHYNALQTGQESILLKKQKMATKLERWRTLYLTSGISSLSFFYLSMNKLYTRRKVYPILFVGLFFVTICGKTNYKKLIDPATKLFDCEPQDVKDMVFKYYYLNLDASDGYENHRK